MAKKTIKYYKSINEIPVYIFYKIIETKEIRFIIKKYKEDDYILINDELKNKLQNCLSNIIDDYNEATSDKKVIKSIKSESNIAYLEYVYDTVQFVLKSYSRTNLIEFFDILNALDEGYGFDKTKDVEKQVQSYLKKLKALKLKIKILKIKHSKLYNQKEAKETDYLKKLDDIALNIEMVLELKYQIDTMKTSLRRWVNLLNKAKEISDGKAADRR
jgi:hypothetical protein